MKQHREESGQAIVLIILAIVGMFGFAALAVDGGRIYAERRRAQNAVDSAAYAGAFAGAVNPVEWHQKALTQLKQNGFEDADYLPNAGQLIDVELYNPPKDAASGRYENPNEYYQVVLTTTVEPVFAQIVTNGPFRITVEAVARAQTYSGVTPGRAMFATSPNGCEAIKYHGSQGIKVIGGDIYSSSTRTGGTPDSTDPNSCCSAGQDGGNSVTVEQGGLYTVGSFCAGSGTVSAENGVHTNVPSQDIPTVPMPYCDDLTTRTYPGGSATLEPGYYPNGIKITGSRSKVTLNPGMYCLDDDLSANGGILTGYGVLIVMLGDAADPSNINISGNTTVRLAQNSTLVDGKGQVWGGMLFYMPYANTGYISMSGNAGTHYTGTIYAPGPRNPASQTKCNIEGTSSSLAMSSSLICYSMKIGGTSNVTIYYREEQNYRVAPSLGLAR